jgi:hypothetical protein
MSADGVDDRAPARAKVGYAHECNQHVWVSTKLIVGKNGQGDQERTQHGDKTNHDHYKDPQVLFK